MGQDGRAPGSAQLQLAPGVPLLRAEEQVFAAMLEGWRDQQLARNLAPATIRARTATIRAFAVHADAFPWAWRAQMLDEWLGDLRAVRGLRRSTIRGRAEEVAAFCRYLTDPAYGWAEQCQARFGTHPVQVAHEWNTATHVQEAEGDPRKRAFTVAELQAFFDYADDQAVRVPAGTARGGWPRTGTRHCSRSSTGWGCAAPRRRCWTWRTSAPTRHAPEFGRYGMCHVRLRQGQEGAAAAAPQRANGDGPGRSRRSPTTWTEQVRPPVSAAPAIAALWLTERGRGSA